MTHATCPRHNRGKDKTQLPLLQPDTPMKNIFKAFLQPDTPMTAVRQKFSWGIGRWGVVQWEGRRQQTGRKGLRF